MALVALVTLALAASSRKGSKKSAAQPAEDCIVTSTLQDGTEERRDCFLLGEQEMKPGAKGYFQSCTQ